MADSIVSQLPMFDPVEIRLTKGYVALVDSIDADLAEFKWHAEPDKSGRVYVTRTIYPEGISGARVILRIHRVILERVLGRHLEKSELVDHVDNSPLNNRRSNLRIADHVRNGQNRKVARNNKLGVKGVVFDRGKYVANICVNGTPIALGRFSTIEDARQAYLDAARFHFGEFFNPGATPQEQPE